VAYTLGIYLLNIFLAFISPKFDPSLELDQDEGVEDGSAGGLPRSEEDEFRPFVRRLPEFKFWFSATRAVTIALVCSFFTAFDLPVFWPVLVMYWLILFFLTSKLRRSGRLRRRLTLRSEATNSAHGQVSICPVYGREDAVRLEIGVG
jgi:Rer1 family